MTHSIISLGKGFTLDPCKELVSPVGSVGASKGRWPFEVAAGDPHLSALLLRASSPEWTARPAFSVGHFDQLILGAPFSLHGFPAPFRCRFPALLLCLANFCGALFACLQKLEHCASTSSLLRLLAQSSVLPLRGHRRVSHADGHAVFKVRCWIWQ